VHLRKTEALEVVRRWNEEHPVGTPVQYNSPFLRRDGLLFFRTRTPAVLLPGKVPGLWLIGNACAVCLEWLQLADESDLPTAETIAVAGTERARREADRFLVRLDIELRTLGAGEREKALNFVYEGVAARVAAI
jgi:hypothetical protein